MDPVELVAFEERDLNTSGRPSFLRGQAPAPVTCELVAAATLDGADVILYATSAGERRVAVYAAGGAHVASVLLTE